MFYLFTKTWRNDLPWIDLAIKSVSFFCTEPIEWVLVTERESMNDLKKITSDLNSWNPNHKLKFFFHIAEEVWPESPSMGGYHGQQWVKLNAHKIMGNKIFWNWDSDVMAQKPFSSSDFIGKSGRPIYWFSHFNTLMANNGQDNPAHEARKALMRQIFRWDGVCFEFMRCMPICMNGSILDHGSRNIIWNECKDKLLRKDQSFSEFNIYGQFAQLYFPDSYEWRNVEAQPPTWSGGYKEGGHGSGSLDGISIATQCFSWGGIPEHISRYVNGLKSYIK